MENKEMINALNKRIDKVEELINEVDDSDRVDINVYDLIAYSLVNNHTDNSEGKDYYSLISTLLEVQDDDNQVSFHGNVFKSIINYMITKKMSEELYEELIDIYFWNEKRLELKDIISNNKYDKKEKRIVFEKYNYLDNLINEGIDRITYLDEENDYKESDFTYNLGK